MNENECLSKMIRPGAIKQKWNLGIIQLWVTRACDKACCGCTQGSNLGGKPGMVTPEQFEEMCINIADYHGTVGMFGGNPAMHPQFETLCGIMRKHIPFQRRGLWCNHPLGKGIIMRSTFNPMCSNLNVHLDQSAYDEFLKDWPESKPFGLKEDSRHSPPFAAMQDMTDLTEADRWDLISRCDINIHWSGMYGVFRGQPRFWFCEVAGAQSMLHQNNPDYPDTGLPLTPRVWDKSMHEYAAQVRYHCHACGIPLRGFGELATKADGTEHTTATHADIYKPKQKERLVQLVTTTKEAHAFGLNRATDYVPNSKAVEKVVQ